MTRNRPASRRSFGHFISRGISRSCSSMTPPGQVAVSRLGRLLTHRFSMADLSRTFCSSLRQCAPILLVTLACNALCGIGSARAETGYMLAQTMNYIYQSGPFADYASAADDGAREYMLHTTSQGVLDWRFCSVAPPPESGAWGFNTRLIPPTGNPSQCFLGLREVVWVNFAIN